MSPVLVVAGAGSGKTETMTSRVVWLVANGFVEPDQVLGLTFTRKAATELAERIGARLRLLQQRDVWHPRTDDEETGAEVLGGTPTVSTYHSYAGRLVREHALRLGFESESRLLSEAAAWQYASEVVSSYDGPMDDVQFAESTVTAAVVDLAGEMAEHLVGVGDVAAYLDLVLDALAALPPHAGARGKDLPGEVKKMREQLRARAGVLPMVERYLALKRSRDAMDFADQMALAARLAMTFPDIGSIERQRFGAVLLDEFQDTSAAQLELLRSLFVAPGEPSPVTAVGDPHQSIYGWRGASATTLSEFRVAFGTSAGPAPVLPLATSWRNDVGVLEVANAVAAPLRAGSKVPVDQLVARPGAGTGRVAAARVETAGDEAALVATWLSQRRAAGAESLAVLCRKRSQFAPIIDALESRGIPYEVVGLGGLLLTPEVEDITALLHVVNDPSRGDQLMRLLTGPLCRLGAADLDGLMAWARHQQDLRLGVDDRSAPQDDDDAEGVMATAGVLATDEAPATAGTGTTAAEGPERAPRAVRDQAPDSSDRVSIVEAVDDPPPSGVGQLGRQAGQRHGTRPAPGAAAGDPPAALAVCLAAGRPGGGGRARPRPRHRGAGPSGLHPRRGQSPPRRLRRRRRHLHRERRPAEPGRFPRLAGGGTQGGARARQGLHRGLLRRGAGADRARREGTGVGRRGGARARRGIVPCTVVSGQPLRRRAVEGVRRPSSGAGSAACPTAGSRSPCAVTVTGCRSSTGRRAWTGRTWRPASRTSCAPAVVTVSRRSDGWPTSRSPGPGPTCC